MFDFQFDSLGGFLAMGGYAGYVWSAYACFFIVFGWNLIQPRRERRKLLQLLKARQQREAALSAQASSGNEE
jgi:heme exporter protein D